MSLNPEHEKIIIATLFRPVMHDSDQSVIPTPIPIPGQLKSLIPTPIPIPTSFRLIPISDSNSNSDSRASSFL